MPGVLVCGNIVYDILVRPVDAIPWGGSLWVDSIDQSLGGNGASTSFAVARMGVASRLLGAVGQDPFGDAALARLASAGVDLTHVARPAESATATTVALVQSSGTRAFLHRPGVSRQAFAEPIEFSRHASDGFRRFHLGNPFAVANLRRDAAGTLRRAREAGFQTSMDTGWDALGEWMQVIAPCLPFTGLLFVNEDEACKLTGESDPRQAATAFHSAGARAVVVKLGARGCMVFVDGRQFQAPGFAVDAIDTTGAGDCFAGGYLAALERGGSHEDAARLANGVGALSVQSLGATSGLRSYEATLEWMTLTDTQPRSSPQLPPD